jgi:heat shock protein HslJ
MRRILTIALVAVALAGCTATKAPRPQTAASSTQPLPAAERPAPATAGSITAAAIAAADRLFAADTAHDAGLDATWLRHRELLTAALTQQLLAMPAEQETATWRAWRIHQATITAHGQLVTDDAPADSATLAVRRLSLLLTANGGAGWRWS